MSKTTRRVESSTNQVGTELEYLVEEYRREIGRLNDYIEILQYRLAIEREACMSGDSGVSAVRNALRETNIVVPTVNLDGL